MKTVRSTQKLFALLIALCMLLSSTCMTAYAADESTATSLSTSVISDTLQAMMESAPTAPTAS